jgi:hypothetical protein
MVQPPALEGTSLAVFSVCAEHTEILVSAPVFDSCNKRATRRTNPTTDSLMKAPMTRRNIKTLTSDVFISGGWVHVKLVL